MKQFYDGMKEHTKVKIEFYKKYLERYLSILVNSGKINEINVFDLFCGTGMYADNQFGSPIVAKEAIQSVMEIFNASDVKINLFVNDKDKESISSLKRIIHVENSSFNISIHNKDVDDLYDVILNQVMSQNNYKVKNLIFLDPFGYSKINIEFVRNIMKLGNSEFIIFLPITHIYRFISNRENVESLDNFLSSLDIQNTSFSDVFELIDCIKESLKFNTDIFGASYHLQRDSSNVHALFFLTSNILGLERIIDIKWELNEEDGKGFNIPENHNRLFADYEKNEKIRNSFNILYDLTKDYLKADRNNIELYQFCLLNEFRITHINNVLRQLQNEDLITVFDYTTKTKVRKSAFYINYNYYKEKVPKVIVKLI